MSAVVSTNEAVPPLQFSLRTLLVAVLLFAIGCTFLQRHLSVDAQSLEYRITAAVVATVGAIAGYVAGRICGFAARPLWRYRTLEVVGWGLLGLLAATTLYLLWSHDRLVNFPAYMDDPLYPRAFPFPDQMLWHYEAWLDVQNPLPRNHIKLHGEIHAVIDHIRILIFFCVVLAFFALGILAPSLKSHLKEIATVPFRH